MNVRILAATLLAAAAATPALAQGLDSRHSPYPASAYSGFAGTIGAGFQPRSVTHDRPAAAYRFSGQHAGGPADGLPRY